MNKSELIQRLEKVVKEMRKEVKSAAPNGEYPDDWSGDACAMADNISDYADDIENILKEAKSG